MNLPVRNMGEYGQVTVMVQKQMKFHRSLGLPEPGPINETGTKLNHRGIQIKELVLEPESPFAEVQLPAFAQKLIKRLLIQLPRAMLIGIRQG